MFFAPLAGASGAEPPAQSTLLGHAIVCVPPAVRKRVNFPTCGLDGGFVKLNVVLPEVVSV